MSRKIPLIIDNRDKGREYPAVCNVRAFMPFFAENLEKCNLNITFSNVKRTFMKQNPFPYSYWAKILGVLIVIAGIISFFLQYYKKGVYDFNELAVGLSWGFVFIFFSK